MAKPEIQYIRYYTAGSAAEKLAPAFREDASPAQLTRKKRKPILYIDPVAILGMVTAFILIVCMFVALSNFNQAQEEYAQAAVYASSLERENQRLTENYKKGYNLEEVRLEAVLMGYVPQSQVTHITIEPVEPVPQPQEPTLWETLWTAIFA